MKKYMFTTTIKGSADYLIYADTLEEARIKQKEGDYELDDYYWECDEINEDVEEV